MTDWQKLWKDTAASLMQEGWLRDRPWNPVGTVISVHRDQYGDFEEVDRWLVEHAGERGVDWNKAPTYSVVTGIWRDCWQDYAVLDSNVAFEFKMVFG